MLERMKPWPHRGARVALALASILFAAPSLAEPPAAAPQAKSVLELFTSQGCSSCPPADALLAKLAKRPDLVTLSYSVDYWNYLGWRDTLSSAANSNRQREYARVRGDGQVYTPQLVIDGITHVVGSDETAVERVVKDAAKKLEDVKVPVSMHAEGDTLVIGIGAAPDKSDKRTATIWLALAKEDEKVSITRGENRGKMLSYHHPVRELTPVGMWKGEAMTLKLPLKELKAMGGDCLVALLQVENAGAILGAAEYEML
jgi:hypothetical protein